MNYWNIDRVTALSRILELEKPDRAIIFCNTRDETQTVATALARRGISVDYLSGELEQSAREKVLLSFRENKIQHLVATDVAARGIDVSNVTHVVNFGFPGEAETYVHRTGRTGRAGKRGVAVSLFGPADVGSVYMLRLTYGIRPIERALAAAAEERARREAERLSTVRASMTGAIDEETVSLARRVLAHDEAESIVAHLLQRLLHDATRDALSRESAASAAPAPAPVAAPSEPLAHAEPAPAARVIAEPVAPAEDEASSPVDAAANGERVLPKRSRNRSEPRAERPRRIDVHGGEDPGLEPETVESEMGEVRVAVGRRDGARGGELARLVRDKAQLAPKDIGSIKVYDRFAIIPVRADAVDAVIEALADVTLDERPLTPERGRLGGPSIVSPAVSDEE
jgi:ATP-dependent RNA helicase DeaD